ncbi:hypothetical protein PBI_SCTP2_317 [Salicola phage SCTP-2]|nr:hypothetical protein PBI_SCTP2_317 [Salicola phage SCTP-2]
MKHSKDTRFSDEIAEEIGSKVIYMPNYVNNCDEAYDKLINELDWEHRGTTPRYEYYANDWNRSYAYGSEKNPKKFDPKPWHPVMLGIRYDLEKDFNCTFDVCFINMYRNKKDHLGWHSDDSPEMDTHRPIVTVSLGAERNFWFRRIGGEEVYSVFLENGSACVMPARFQETYQHRIPKHDRDCGPRLSLTFRGFVDV